MKKARNHNHFLRKKG